MSDKKLEVYKSIAAVQGELAKEGISKDMKNQQQGFMYRGIDQVYGALAPLLSQHNLCILPRIVSREMVERVSSSNKPLFHTTLQAEFDIVSAIDGSVHTVVSYGEAMDMGDKSAGKAMSYAYKAMAFMLFAIPTEGDNDPDATTHDVKANTGKPAEKPKDAPPPAEVSKAQQELLKELGDACDWMNDPMVALLKEVSHYDNDGKTGELTLADLKKKSDHQGFQRWIGSTLGKLREKLQREKLQREKG